MSPQKYTRESALAEAAALRARGLEPVQPTTRYKDLLRDAGIPYVRGAQGWHAKRTFVQAGRWHHTGGPDIAIFVPAGVDLILRSGVPVDRRADALAQLMQRREEERERCLAAFNAAVRLGLDVAEALHTADL